MAEIKKSLKGIWLKSMEAISNTASNIASNTKYKVDEMNIVNRRREILSDFGVRSYELWQKGEKFPETLEALLQELSELDEALNAIRIEKLAGVKTEENQPEEAQGEDAEQTAEEQQPAGEDAADEADTAKASVSEKIDGAVEVVGATFRKLGSKIEDGIEALTKAMKPKAEEAAPVDEDAKEESAAPVINVEEKPAEEPVVDLAADLPEEPTAPVITIEPEQSDEETQA